MKKTHPEYHAQVVARANVDRRNDSTNYNCPHCGQKKSITNKARHEKFCKRESNNPSEAPLQPARTSPASAQKPGTSKPIESITTGAGRSAAFQPTRTIAPSSSEPPVIMGHDKEVPEETDCSNCACHPERVQKSAVHRLHLKWANRDRQTTSLLCEEHFRIAMQRSPQQPSTQTSSSQKRGHAEVSSSYSSSRSPSPHTRGPAVAARRPSNAAPQNQNQKPIRTKRPTILLQ